jgi:hypothetical protein
MRMFRFNKMFKLSMLAAAVFMMVTLASAEDKKPGGMPSGEDMQKMMEMCKQMAAPSAEHAALAKMAGNWDVTSKMWMDPSQPPMESKGSCSDKMILGGRVVQSEFTGDMMGQPFHGFGLTGYDKFRKVYWMTWNDDMGTGLSTAEGTGSADGKVITMLGTMDDPMQNIKDMPVKYVTTVVDDNNFKFEMFTEAGTAKEAKAMEINYKRK